MHLIVMGGGVAGGWRRLNVEELHNLFASPYYWGDHVKEDEMGRSCSTDGLREKCVQNFGSEILKGRDHSEHLGMYWTMILERILWKWGAVWIGFIWRRIGTDSGLL